MPRTIDAFRHNKMYDDERISVHEAVIAGQLGKGAPPPVPTAYFTIGCIGSGKTTIMRKFVSAHRRATSGATNESLTRVAADDVREALPGYGDGLGSRVVAPECFDVTYPGVYTAARDAGLDLVYDTIGRLARDAVVLEPNLRELRDRGFKIHLLRAHAPLDVCVRRAEQRALATGRLVDADEQALLYDEPIEVERRLRAEGVLDGWLVIDTSAPDDHLPMLEASEEWHDVFPRLLEIVRNEG